MMKTLLFSLSLIVLIGCASTQTEADFSTPKSTVQTFIDAADQKDKDILSKCFTERAEWDEFRNKSMSDKELEEGRKFTSGAQIGKVEMDGDDKAIVYVKFKSRDEKMHMIKKEGRWFINDF